MMLRERVSVCDTDPVLTRLAKHAERNRTDRKVSRGRQWKWGVVLEGGQDADLHSVGR